jgi:hypothetical protein
VGSPDGRVAHERIASALGRYEQSQSAFAILPESARRVVLEIGLSPLAARCFREPLGYAGDFEMMNMVYRNDSLGGTPLRPGTEPRRPR